MAVNEKRRVAQKAKRPRNYEAVILRPQLACYCMLLRPAAQRQSYKPDYREHYHYDKLQILSQTCKS